MFLFYLVVLIMTYSILKFTFYVNISKYLTYSRISGSIYIDVLQAPKFRILNREMSDKEIAEDFYQDARTAFDKLKPGKYYCISTHSLIKRQLQNNPKIEITDIKDKKEANLNILNLVIGKRTFNEKRHRSYKIKFKMIET